MVEVLLEIGTRGDSVGHDTLERLFGAARDQQKPGLESRVNVRWIKPRWEIVISLMLWANASFCVCIL
jgi:hypothetical protein